MVLDLTLVSKPIDAFLLATSVWLLYKLGKTIRTRVRTTKLRGPPSSHWFFGVSKDTGSHNGGQLFEEWAKEYGPVYRVPALAGSKRVVLTDPKAVAHFYSLETFTYVHTPMSKRGIENIVSPFLPSPAPV